MMTVRERRSNPIQREQLDDLEYRYSIRNTDKIPVMLNVMPAAILKLQYLSKKVLRHHEIIRDTCSKSLNNAHYIW